MEQNELNVEALELGYWWSSQEISRNLQPKSNVRIGVVISNRLYSPLRYECHIVLLEEYNWQSILRYGNLDFILIESCFESCTGHWRHAQSTSCDASQQLTELLKEANNFEIPIAYWQTLDTTYDTLFSKFAQSTDCVFCADPRSISSYKKKGVLAELLPPAVQPKRHNPFLKYDKERIRIPVLYDGWEDLHRLGKDIPSFLYDLSKHGLIIIDSEYMNQQRKPENLGRLNKNILACVDKNGLYHLLKSTQVGITFEQSTYARTHQQWWSLEAISCGAEILHQGIFSEDDIRNGLVKAYYEAEFLEAITGLLKDERKRLLSVRDARREILRKHTVSHRLQRIYDRIGLNSANSETETPLVSCLSVVETEAELEETLSRFRQQTYNHLELIIAVTSKEEFLPGNINSLPVRFLHAPFSDLYQAYELAANDAEGSYCIDINPDCHEATYIEDLICDALACDSDLFSPLLPRYFTNSDHFEILDKCYAVYSAQNLKQVKSSLPNMISGKTASLRSILAEQNPSLASLQDRLNNRHQFSTFLPRNVGLPIGCHEYLRLLEGDRQSGRPPVREKIIGGMATIPSRVESLPTVLERLIPQLDHVFVYLNGHETVPDCLLRDKVSYAWSKTHGDLAASGKFFFLEEAQGGYFFTFDDDFLYPHDYVWRMVKTLKKYKDQFAACVHGSIFGNPLEWFFQRVSQFGSLQGLEKDRFVTLVGSGTLAFHAKSIDLCFDDFFPMVMCDVQFSIKAREQNVPIVSIARQPEWLQTIDMGIQHSVPDYWTRMLIDDEGRTELSQRYSWDFFVYSSMVLEEVNSLYPYISEDELKLHKFDDDFIVGARQHNMPPFWNPDLSELYHIRTYQFLRKRLAILDYMNQHGREPNLSDLFTKEDILLKDWTDMHDLKSEIKRLRKELGSNL